MITVPNVLTLVNIIQTVAIRCGFRSTLYEEQQCAELDGHYDSAGKFCYHNRSQDNPDCGYFVNLKCYPYVDSSYTASTCANIGGFFTTSSTTGEAGNFCYYRQFNCTFHSANNQCYRFKSLVNNRSECDIHSGYYQHGYCFNECPTYKYLINEICYDYRSAYTPQKCTELRGYFNEAENYCYYGKNCMSGHMENQRCYPFVESGYTASTCANIGGYFTTVDKQGKYGRFCYFVQFNCTFHAINGQCYRIKLAVNHKTECDSLDGYYGSRYCYYECPDTKYLFNNKCYETRSLDYTQSDCQSVGGLYAHKYCYIDKCRYSSVNNHCYKQKTTSYSNGTCYNIGGYYAVETVSPYNYYCYYNSFNCRSQPVNGQCYSRSSNHSQLACRTIPDSYFDVSNNTCYYYCTEMPKLRQCFVADDPSLSGETCANIGGVYSNRTCYYIASYCPKYGASNRQCYSDRSSALTCNTCQNIRGFYENLFCYYNQDHCSGFRFEKQCYSNRSSAYLSDSCNNMGGFYHNGYCYYEANKCRNMNYRNCTCFRHRTVSKTPATCANIGGYYDFGIQQCFYNSSACTYYNKNNQCYRYRNAELSHKTCTSVRGYYADFACYFDKPYHNCTAIPNLGECIVANNPSFTRETCKIIGGNYYNSTCHYTMLQCLLYNTSNGECYSNRSADLTCNSCQNIEGHYENGYCYYYRNVCSRYNIQGQCYSSRSSGYSRYNCRNYKGGLYHIGYCYHETAKCQSASYYSNCTCFRSISSSKTASTCKNLGGYYDVNIQRCFYNLSTCPYYNRNSQCYKYGKAIFSSTTCSLISGYRTYERNRFGQYRYVCYYNEFKCSNWANNQCYRHFSLSYNEGTCASISGYYSENDQGCYYNSFSCSYPREGQCYDTYYSSWSRRQCDEAHGNFYSYYGRCYVSYYYCPSVHSSFNKCYFYTSQSYDCSSCQLLDGVLNSGTCYHNTENCSQPLFLAGNGQCYQNQTTVRTAADCTSMSGETFYNETDDQCYFSLGKCASGHYVNCQCYSHRSKIYNVYSCRHFGGYYVNGRCYYNSSQCPDRYHSINGQCYRQSSSQYFPSTCMVIGGYYDYPSTSGASGTCYYESFNCSSGFTVDRRHCFTNRSATYSRATCRIIGGIYGYLYSGTQYRSAGSYISSSRIYYCLYNTFNCSGYVVSLHFVRLLFVRLFVRIVIKFFTLTFAGNGGCAIAFVEPFCFSALDY